MTRIIAGVAGSARLSVPDSGTRPTSERVREAIFGALDARDQVADAAVLDLFAGSGALGLEAASRGAASVVLVDASKQATAVARKNALIVAKAGAVTAMAVHQSALSFVEQSTRKFDLVLLDPPYDMPGPDLDAVLAALPRVLSDDALVVVETSKRAPAPSLPDTLSIERTKVYGDTAIHFIHP